MAKQILVGQDRSFPYNVLSRFLNTMTTSLFPKSISRIMCLTPIQHKNKFSIWPLNEITFCKHFPAFHWRATSLRQHLCKLSCYYCFLLSITFDFSEWTCSISLLRLIIFGQWRGQVISVLAFYSDNPIFNLKSTMSGKERI